MKQALVILIPIVALSGCANFVQTQRADNAEINSGISYYLPKRMHRLIVTAENLDPEEQKNIFIDATKLFETLNDEVKINKGKWEKRKSLAETTTGDGKAKRDKEAGLAEGEYKTAKILADSAKLDMQEAKRKYDIAKTPTTPPVLCQYDISMKILPQPIEPDTKNPFILGMNHSWLRDDELAIKTTSSGLISSLDVTTTDRTGDIIVEIAKTAAMLGLGLPISAPEKEKQAVYAEGMGAPKPKHCFPKMLKYDEVVDFGDKGIKGVLIVLKTADGLDPNSIQKETTVENNKTAMVDVEWVLPKLIVSINESYTKTAGNLDNIKLKKCNGNFDTTNECPNGILYRRDSTFLVEIRNTEIRNTGKNDVVDFVLAPASTQISMPNLSPVSVIPYESLGFVTTKNKAVFESGMLVSYDTNLPSQALAIAKFPTRVIAEIFGSITNFLQFKIDTTKKQTELADQRTKLDDASKKP